MKNNLKTIAKYFIIALTLATPQLSHATDQGFVDNADVRRSIVIQAAIEQIREKDDVRNTGNLKLVCKEWTVIIQREFSTGQPGWKTWYGVTPQNQHIYEMLENLKLIYRPNPQSDEGICELRIPKGQNPFNYTFDLSGCGDAGKHLSISTGYRKEIKPENESKLEIWLTPRFIIEKNLGTSASHFQEIMAGWGEETAPVGIFWSWGGCKELIWYDYLTSASLQTISSKNFYENWSSALRAQKTRMRGVGNITVTMFSCLFCEPK